jgi:RNA polymerase sigma-70 factor (ECF subfamily)
LLIDDALDEAMRDHWGRLVALLVRQFRRVDLAEECLADAFARAAARWPADGVPDNPPAWLLTTSRNRALDLLKAEDVARRKEPLLVVEELLREPESEDEVAAAGDISDDRLRLVFMTCHPALAPEAQAALALRLVLGVATPEIARLFLVSEPTIAARITRAKKKIVASAIPFSVPSADALDDRIDSAVRAAYLGFTAGYAPGVGASLCRADLAAEAIRLGRLLDELLPGRHVIRAALALMVLQFARRDARSVGGRLVLLADQDRNRWHHDEIAVGLDLLMTLEPTEAYAEELRLQALIAALHDAAETAEGTDWRLIADAYARLDELTDSPVVRLNRAVAVAEADGAPAGLALLDGLDEQLPSSHRLPAVRAELLRRSGDVAGARLAYASAISLCGNDVERTHLIDRSASL